MKKTYETPEINIRIFLDVIVTSGGGNNGGGSYDDLETDWTKLY